VRRTRVAKKDVKPLDISAHASERMLRRGITHNQVAGAIRCPTRTLAGNTDYTIRFERDFPDGRYLVVIAEECKSTYKVVTTYWAGN
jgi:hypothetical protein